MGVDMGGSNQFRVSPEHVKALSDELQGVVGDVQEFILAKGDLLRVPANALDPVSKDAAQTFAQNADSAIQQASAFAANLTTVIDNLNRAAAAYEANDAHGATTFQSRS